VPALKAIETVYKGYRFRSRLEARWAVFFDALDIRWEYEKEGYDLGPAGWYLPDFWLPDYRYWIEIKGEWPTPEEINKAQSLFSSSTLPVILFQGAPLQSYGISFRNDISESGGGAGSDEDIEWIWCFKCQRADLTLGGDDEDVHVVDGEWESIGCWTTCTSDSRLPMHGLRMAHSETPRLLRARDMSRAARFEHGERPFP
jgi:hypothetical protein